MEQFKKYLLVKDLNHPVYRNFNAGLEFFKLKSASPDSAYTSSDGKVTFHPFYVENNPEWFKEVVENKTFEWTDELVKEFVRENFNRQDHNYLPFAIKDFKQLKNNK